MNKIRRTFWGQTLVELVLVMGLAALIIPAIFTGFVASRNGKPQEEQRSNGISVLDETETALNNIKNTNWTALTIDGTYHTTLSGNQWTLASGTSTDSHGITQRVVIGDVMRDLSGAIVTTGGAVDPSTKRIDISISWTSPENSSINSTIFLTRTKNQTFTQTTISDFSAGIASGTAVVATNNSPTDGQVQLTTNSGSGGGGTGGPSADWCSPNLSIAAVDLPKSGVANAISAIQGQIFTGTGDNSSGVSFANVNVTDTNPPVASITGTYNGFKTNDIFGETNYAYLGTDNHHKEIEIVNLTTSPYSEAGYFDAPGNGSGNSVFVSSNVGYMTSGNNLYTFDLSSKSGSRPQLGSLTLDGTGNKIVVVGSYVYVAIGSTSNQLDIVQVSNGGATLTKVGSMSLNAQGAVSVYINSTGTRAYLAAASSSTQNEMFIIDTTTKTAPSLLGSYNTNGMNPKGITAIVADNRAIVVGTGGEEYQVVDISNESSPTRCGGLTIATGVNGVSSVTETDGDSFSYIITGDASAELKIIQGGRGGTGNTNWCSPQTAIVNTLTLPKTGKQLTAQLGNGFVGSGDGTSGVSFTNVGITTPQSPSNPSASVASSYSASIKTNAVYSDGTYAYLAISGTTQQVQILNISSSPYTQVGTITLPNGANANGVYVSNNTAYITGGNMLYTFDVTTKTGSHTAALSSSTLYAESGVTPIGKNIIVSNSRAFVTAAGTAYGLQVFSINGSALKLVGVSNLSYTQSATSLSVNSTGTRGYVGFDNASTTPVKGFYIVDTSASDPPAWWTLPNFYNIVATFDTSGTDPTGIALAAGDTTRLLVSGTGGTNQYQVIDISLEQNPLLCGSLSVSQGIEGVASVLDNSNRGFSYIITDESSNQFKIIQGGSGGGSYKEDGSFESSTFVASPSAGFNRIVASVSQPSQTTLRMQVASAPKVGGSCTGVTYSYVGPDGSNTSFFTPNGSTVASQIPFGSYGTNYQNPSDCFRYKAWFSSWNTAQTPVVNDVTVNYSQ